MSNRDAPRLTPDDRRAQIIRVACARFAQEGYDALSMSQLAVEAGVTRALVYHYFPGKAALLDAVMRHESAILLAATAPDPARNARDNLHASLHAYLAHFAPASGAQLNVHLQADKMPGLVGQLTEANHAIQIERIVAALELDVTPMMHAAIDAWLMFVQRIAMRTAGNPATDAQSIVDICLGSLQAITDHLRACAPPPVQAAKRLRKRKAP